MVETMRWPNASYSALSTVAGVMPKRPAVTRSMVTMAARPLFCKSLATSAMSGMARSLAISLGIHSGKCVQVGIFEHNTDTVSR